MMEELHVESGDFDFFQAVKYLHHFSNKTGGEKIDVGASVRLDEDTVLFGQEPYLDFPNSTLERVEPGYGATKPDKLLVKFIGLANANSPLPIELTKLIVDRLNGSYVRHNMGPLLRKRRGKPDKTLTDFLDIFNHRCISLFYRAWSLNQPSTCTFREEKLDRFRRFVGSFIGIGTEETFNANTLKDIHKIYYSGHLAAHSGSASGLSKILASYFHVPVEICSFTGYWITLDEEYRMKLGANRDGCLLGENTIAGSRYWNCQTRFTIEIGPIDNDTLNQFLPLVGRRKIVELQDWIKHYVDLSLDYNIQFIIRHTEVPRLCLGEAQQSKQRSYLGLNTWLGGSKNSSDARDLLLQDAARIELLNPTPI